MAEPWLLVDAGSLRAGIEVALDGREGRHATAVLRLRSGDRVVLADGEGTTAEAVLRVTGRARCTAEVSSIARTPAPAEPGVELALALLHGRTMDWAVQKAVEVGVQRFLPVTMARSQPPRAAALQRLLHWRETARQALKQCRRPWEMVVADPIPLPELVEQRSAAGGLVADPTGLRPSSLPPGHSRLLVVGPEGGLTADELRLLHPARWPRVWFGPYVLRSETAAIVGAGVLSVMG